MYIRFIGFFVLLLLTTALKAQQFDWTAKAQRIYTDALQLRLADASELAAQAKLEEPNNYMVDFAMDYIDFFRVFIDEEPTAYAEVLKRQTERIDRLSSSKAHSPYRRYCVAEIYVHQAMLHAKFEEYLGAFTALRKAYKLLERNQALYPDFVANRKTLGLMNAVVGTIPEEFRWGVRLLGFKGSIKQGLSEIESVMEYIKSHPDFAFKEETQIVYAFLLLHVSNRPYRAWRVVNQIGLKPRESPMAAFVLATLAMRTGQNDKAIEILQRRPLSEAYHPFHYLDLLLGIAKLHRLDKDAKQHLLNYVQKHPGRHYIKDAYQKLACQALLQGSSSLYAYYSQQAIKKGASTMAVDRKALQEAQRAFPPHAELLKAQLLFDGGYYERALGIIETLNPYTLEGEEQAIEWVYRKARILHRLGYYDKAVASYKKVLEVGSDNPYYYACNAALQIGRIYEYQSKWKEAAIYFERCLALQPQSYRTSLHQKAKAGLERVGG